MSDQPQPLFVDTTVLAYAAGGAHEHREACLRLVELAADRRIVLHASVEALAEFAFHRMRRTERERAADEAALARQMLLMHPLDDAVMDGALELIRTSTLRSRDAVHAATALRAGFTSIVTTDRDFADVPGLRVIAPTDAVTRIEGAHPL